MMMEADVSLGWLTGQVCPLLIFELHLSHLIICVSFYSFSVFQIKPKKHFLANLTETLPLAGANPNTQEGSGEQVSLKQRLIIVPNAKNRY